MRVDINRKYRIRMLSVGMSSITVLKENRCFLQAVLIVQRQELKNTIDCFRTLGRPDEKDLGRKEKHETRTIDLIGRIPRVYYSRDDSCQ